MKSREAPILGAVREKRALALPGRERLAGALALVLLGAVLSSCSHPQSESPGPYNVPATSSTVTTTIPPTAPTTPQTNWVRVAFHGAKVRVPPSWLVVRMGTRPCQSARQPGTIWVGETHRSCPSWSKRAGRSANLVIFGGRSVLPHHAVLGHQRVHGYPADIYSYGPARRYGQKWLAGTAEYWFPTLGVTVAFSGPLGIEVLETIHSTA